MVGVRLKQGKFWRFILVGIILGISEKTWLDAEEIKNEPTISEIVKMVNENNADALIQKILSGFEANSNRRIQLPSATPPWGELAFSGEGG